MKQQQHTIIIITLIEQSIETIPLGTCRGLRLQAIPDNTGSQLF